MRLAQLVSRDAKRARPTQQVPGLGVGLGVLEEPNDLAI
jgi:hypothetical protein